jgi:hypothetical protein
MLQITQEDSDQPRVDTSKDTEHNNVTPFVLSNALRILFNTIGIAGVLAVIGYISLISHQEFLGIKFEINSIQTLSFSAAEFFFETFRVVIEQAQLYYIIALLTACIFIILFWIKYGCLKISICHFYKYIVLIVTILGISSFSLISYELPSMKLRDVLVVGICSQQRVGSSGILDRNTRNLWSWIIDSRGGLKCPTSGNGIGQLKPEEAENKLKVAYTLTLMSIVIGWFLVFQMTASLTNRLIEPFRIIAIFELAVCTFLLPYTYGKIIASTTMPYVSVLLQGKNELPKVETKVILSPGGLQAGEHFLEGKNLLVTDGENSIIVLNFDEGTSRLIEIPRSKISRIEIHERSDALKKRIELSMQNEKSGPIPLN